MKVKMTTDWHIAPKRSGGTTPQSKLELNEYLLGSLRTALDPNYPHLIAGDLLDQFTAETSELLELYHVLEEFLESGQELAVMRGNHDYHPRGSMASSFDLLMGILKSQFPNTLTVATVGTEWKQFVLVPHLPNQDLLDLEIRWLSEVTNKVIVFHANFSNTFAQESDHSLNVSRDQVKVLIEAGNMVVFGHEHDHRTAFGGKLLVLGNAVPSSISDCLGSTHKYAAYFDGTDYELQPLLSINDVYEEVEWGAEDVPEKKFIRVGGSATSDQASAVVDYVTTLRRNSDALVVSNAVKVEGMDEFNNLAEASFEDIKKVDVLEMMLEEFNDREKAVIRELLA